MASLIFTSVLRDIATGAVDMDTDTFYVMASTGSYVPSKNDTRRSDVTNEVTGTGYTAGGNAVTVSVAAVDTTNNRVDITLGGTTWPASTIANAQCFSYYKRRGGLASADELVAVVDNGTPVSTTAGTLTLTASTLRLQN